MASQALMHVRAEVIKFRFVTVAAGYAPGRMPPVRWKIPSRFEQGEATILRLVPALSESRKSLCLNVNPKRLNLMHCRTGAGLKAAEDCISWH